MDSGVPKVIENRRGVEGEAVQNLIEELSVLKDRGRGEIRD